MRRERQAEDPPVKEDLPERETGAGVERSGESAVEQEAGGVEREGVGEVGDTAGEESAPREADRADPSP